MSMRTYAAKIQIARPWPARLKRGALMSLSLALTLVASAGPLQAQARRCETSCAKETRDERGCCRPCPEGMARAKETKGHCCWPGQTWSTPQRQCLGIPRCPEGMTLQRGQCIGHQSSAAKRAQIKELLVLTGAAKHGLRSLDQLIQSYQSMLPQVPARFWSEYRAQFDEQAMLELLIPPYDKYLSQDDITALLTFYRSEAGQKFARVMPDIQRESRQAGQLWGLRLAQAIEARLKAEGYLIDPAPPSESQLKDPRQGLKSDDK